MNDKRLWGGLGDRITYAISILPTEPVEMIDENMVVMIDAFGGDSPMLIEFKDSKLLSRSSFTPGSSFENFLAIPYSPRNMLWALEARMFCEAIMALPPNVYPEVRSKLVKQNNLWESLLLMFGVPKSSFFEFQIHGSLTTKDISKVMEVNTETGETENIWKGEG